MTNSSERTRRLFIHSAGVVGIATIAGCSSNGDGNGDGDNGGDGTVNGAGGDLSGPVPGQYETATSQGGSTRDPENLQSKQSLQYQSEPDAGDQCSGCTFYIPDKNGDGLGARTVVEGKIEPPGWCQSFSPHQG